jgi:Tol biopolymer transport system component
MCSWDCTECPAFFDRIRRQEFKAMIGTRLAHYEITQHIGSGGMGEVYQATDSKLGRSVAIKLLPETFMRDAERVARLQREARVLASLNHPNIGGIYGIEDVGSRHFLVLELVPGETLADRIQRGPIPVDEALAIAAQIAEALEIAHEAGVVHRDLKPANVKITPDGKVKVLDFGLAKAFAADEAEFNITNSPTMSLAATQRGVILGTAAYMSPEQARGRNVDRRADIWAFGVLLYEMVTGKRLFQGEDLTDTLAAVVRDQPDLSTTPSAVRRILEQCLEKDPKKRLRHISGFTLLLGNSAGGSAPSIPASAPIHVGARWIPWAVAGVALIGLAALAFVHLRESAPDLRAVQFPMDPPQDTTFANQYGGFAASPDGRSFIFTATAKGNVQLWLRQLDSMVSRPLSDTEGGNFPTWSPDSKSLAFFSGGKLKRIEIAGGAALMLADAPQDPVSPTGTWNREGVILFGSSAGLQRVSASGGGATLLTKADPAKMETGHGYPQFLPDGHRFLYLVASTNADVQGVYASSLEHPDQRQLVIRTSTKAVYVPAHGAYSPYLLWLQEQKLLAQRFDLDTLRLEGDPVFVADEIGLNPNNSMRAAYWASDAGLLIYFALPTLGKRQLAWIGKDGKSLGLAGPDDTLASVALAPDGQRVAVARSELQAGKINIDVWIREFARPVMPRLTFDAAEDRLPAWSPDGKQIAYSSAREGGVFQIFRKDASGAGQEERLTDGPTLKALIDWSKDGKYLLYREVNSQTGRDLMALPLEGERKPIVVVKTPYQENTGAISPDGRWVAYTSNDSGVNQLYAQAFPGLDGAPAGRWQLSTDGAYDVKWRRDQEIYYETSGGKMMAVTVQSGPQGIRAETPRELFSADFQINSLHEFDVTADGQRFLIILNATNQGIIQRVTVVSNWQAALRK